MTTFNPEAAIREALDIAKIICANPNVEIPLTKESAEDLADFIRTLEAKFLNENPSS